MNSYNNNPRLSFREIYQQSFNTKNIPTRLFIIILGLIAEIPILYASFWIGGAVVLLLRLIGIDLSLGLRPPNFVNTFYSAMPLFFLHILLFTIFRFVAKFRTCYLDLTIVLFAALGILSPYLKESTGWEGFLVFDISILYFCTAITFACFTVAYVSLKHIKKNIRERQKTFIAFITAIPTGALLSWLAWTLILRY